jgi:hypothetical protein
MSASKTDEELVEHLKHEAPEMLEITVDFDRLTDGILKSPAVKPRELKGSRKRSSQTHSTKEARSK